MVIVVKYRLFNGNILIGVWQHMQKISNHFFWRATKMAGFPSQSVLPGTGNVESNLMLQGI